MFKYMMLALITIGAVSLEVQSKENPRLVGQCGKNKRNCQDLNNSCKCYCAWECDVRDKKPDDKPVYVENDPAGIYCYCKQRDLDNFRNKGCHLNDRARLIAANDV
jgi:hypothetical protein